MTGFTSGRGSSMSRLRSLGLAAAGVGLLASIGACGGDDKATGTVAPTAATAASESTPGTTDAEATEATEQQETIGVALITKTADNPFFVAMTKGAQAEAASRGIDLTVSAGNAQGDDAAQITAIENAISRGDKGILITPTSAGVNGAIEQARDAGLYVIALDTPPDPPETVDITFATDNLQAGRLIGEWTAQTLGGKPAVIALLDLFDDQAVSVDYERDQGFLTGMGIDVGDPKVNGDEAESGDYTGGTYTIACNAASQGVEDGGRTAMENCLSRNPDINVVYTINEPAAYGASQALEAVGKDDAIVVSVDGGCPGVQFVADGVIGATAQQYPLNMAALGVEAIDSLVRDGVPPEVTPGLSFYDTGVALVTDSPADGVESIDSTKGTELCWG